MSLTENFYYFTFCNIFKFKILFTFFPWIEMKKTKGYKVYIIQFWGLFSLENNISFEYNPLTLIPFKFTVGNIKRTSLQKTFFSFKIKKNCHFFLTSRT